MSHLKLRTLNEQLFQNVALAASEASVLIEKLITSEAFMLMYVLWQKQYNKRLEECVPVPWYQAHLIALSWVPQSVILTMLYNTAMC